MAPVDYLFYPVSEGIAYSLQNCRNQFKSGTGFQLKKGNTMFKFSVTHTNKARTDYTIFSCWGFLDDICYDQVTTKDDNVVDQVFVHMSMDTAAKVIEGLQKAIRVSKEIDTAFYEIMRQQDEQDT